MIKVAIIEPVGGHGGMDYYDYGLCGGLAAAGVDAVLHTCDETILPHKAGFEVRHSFRRIYGGDAAWKRGLRYVLGTLRALFSAVREGRTVVHFHFFHVGSVQAMQVLLARMLRRRVVITAHDVESFVESLEVPALSRWVYRWAHSMIAHNRVSEQALIKRSGLKPELVALIPHGNYLHSIHPLPPRAKARQALGVPLGAKVLLFFGQIKDVKGLDLLLEAMAQVVRQHPDAVLLIAGKPWKSDFSIYTRMIERLGIHKFCITHIRYIPDEEVPIYYGASDLVVLPYRRIYQSGVVLMAMSYGKAVIVSDLPGMTEIVRDGENGFVFRQGNKESLAESLIKILNDAPLRQHLAAKGFDHVRRYYDWQDIGSATASLYKAEYQSDEHDK